jgi:xylan 1,4-beta-xylosidase
MLDEIKWGADGWPTINNGHGPSARAASPFGVRELNAEYSFFDDFTEERLPPGWQWPQSNRPDFKEGRGRLLLQPSGGTDGNPTAAVLARTTTMGNYVALAVVDPRSLKSNATAGLSAYGDSDNSLGIGMRNGGGVFIWRKERDKPTQTTDATEVAGGGPVVYLRMTVRDGHRYRFAMSGDGRTWKDVGEELEGDYLPPWDRGVRVALVAGGSRGAVAWFESLRIEPTK